MATAQSVRASDDVIVQRCCNPPNQIAPFEEWVNDHDQGTPIVVRYASVESKSKFLVNWSKIRRHAINRLSMQTNSLN